MMETYIVGVLIALVLSIMSYFFDEDVKKEDIIIMSLIITGLAFLSWVTVMFLLIGIILELINKRKEAKVE